MKVALFINLAWPSHRPLPDLLDSTKFYIFKVNLLIYLYVICFM